VEAASLLPWLDRENPAFLPRMSYALTRITISSASFTNSQRKAPMSQSYSNALEDLQLRLDRLERRNRWLKGFWFAFLVLCGALFLLAQPRPGYSQNNDVAVQKAVAAQYILLVDERGKQRGYLAASSKSGAMLILQDAQGATRLGLSERGITLTDQNGKVRVTLQNGQKTPFLALYDDNGNIFYSSAAQTNK
jgi:hypothetical protein